MWTKELESRYQEAIDNSEITVAELESLIVDIDNAQDDETVDFNLTDLKVMLHNLNVKLSVLCYQLTIHEDF